MAGISRKVALREGTLRFSGQPQIGCVLEYLVTGYETTSVVEWILLLRVFCVEFEGGTATVDFTRVRARALPAGTRRSCRRSTCLRARVASFSSHHPSGHRAPRRRDVGVGFELLVVDGILIDAPGIEQ